MNILCLLPATDKHRAELAASAPGANIVYTDAANIALPELVAAADAIVGNVDPELLRNAENLKLLQLQSAGYDNYLAAGTVPAGAELCCAVGAYGQAVSEHMFAMLLSLIKRLPGYEQAQREHDWCDLGPVSTLRGAHVLVLGAGDIGTHFAELCRAMGAHVEGVKRNTLAYPSVFEAIHSMDELADALAGADVVASFLPSSAATRKLADAAFFEACKPGAWFVNGGRGDFVDNGALIAALESGKLAGAALDVCDPEPLPAEDPLWDAPNLLLTPHISGWLHLSVTLDNIMGIAAENLRHLAAGEPLRNHVEH